VADSGRTQKGGNQALAQGWRTRAPPGTDHRVEQLRRVGDLDVLSAIIGIYVDVTIPDPNNTVPYAVERHRTTLDRPGQNLYA